jgi:EpsI family protein
MSTAPARSPLPLPTTAALGLLAAGAAAVVWVLARFWGANPEYADRFLILAGAAWAAWNIRQELAALPARPTRLGLLPLLAGATAFPVGWFLLAQVATRPVIIWWLAAAWLAVAVGVILVLGGWRHLRRLAFPLVFVLFALPIPNRVLVPLQFYLQSATTSAAAAVLPAIGVSVERTGFVLGLPGGDLGVAEACSGVRSVTALTAIAAFVAHLRGFGPIRGLVLLALSVPVIAAVNAFRVVLSGLVQEHIGAEYIQGHWHEALGIGMVLVGLALVVGLAKLIGRKQQGEKGSGGEGETNTVRGSFSPSPLLHFCPSLVLALSAVATVAAQFLGAGTEQELVVSAPIDQVPYRLGNWKGKDLPIPDYVREMLTFDAATSRVYIDPQGYEVHAWVIYWSSRNMVKGYHHPDVCWPNKGFRMVAHEIEPVRVGDGTIPVTVRVFARGKERQQLILYWTQEGRKVWTEDDERVAQLAGDSHDWLGERLFRRGRPEAAGRLVVLIGTQTWGDGTVIRTETLKFTRLLAAAVYDTCPWAAVAPEPAIGPDR